MKMLRWLSDLFKPPQSWIEKSDIMKIDVAIVGNGGFDFGIVGESHYQIRIWSMLPKSDSDKVRAYFVARLELEDDNEHDNKAIAVTIDKLIVGHFSRDDARAYRKWLTSKHLDGSQTCRAVIVGSKRNSYGIWLDTPFLNK